MIIFSVHTAQSHDSYSILDVSQWRFYLAPASAIDQDSIALTQVQKRFSPALRYEELPAAVARAQAAVRTAN